jgi:hypothetical protein
MGLRGLRQARMRPDSAFHRSTNILCLPG